MWKLFKSHQKWIISENFDKISQVLQQTRRMVTKGHPSLAAVLKNLREFAPEHLAESWDNVGLLIEPSTAKPISGIILTNDLTEDVLRDAVNAHAGLIISYHPPIFEGLKRITQDKWKGRIVASCLENGIAVYSPHTAWDSVRGGVNDWLGSFLSKEFDAGQPIIPNAKHPDCGAGRLYESLKDGMTLEEIINGLKSHTKIPNLPVALVHPLTQRIKSVALCAGSGASVLKDQKVEVFITGEMAHHAILDANHCGTSVILTHHSNSERGFLTEMQGMLQKDFPEVSIICSTADKDPLTIG
uniref:NIF3-like protein 1 n=1 Tax=Nyssomyia neivai TaxID=330878 RepID=A0A1L8DKS3_9DIPT